LDKTLSKTRPHILVLAGGFGTRLRSAVADVPKPLAPIAGQPYLGYLIDSWVAQGVGALTFLLHYQAGLIQAYVVELEQAGRLKGCKVRFLVEPEPMGTGGAVAYAVHELQLHGDFLVSNADTWLGSGVVQLAGAQSPAIAVIPVANTQRYGRVRLAANKISLFEEKQDSYGEGLINAGLYHLEGGLFAHWNGQPFSLEHEIFPALVKAGSLNSVTLDTDFIDIGVPEDYYRFCQWITSNKVGAL
jgi:D-glycero-alpha-D-manno-heptose 1-phosphate guanylyltransferase